MYYYNDPFSHPPGSDDDFGEKTIRSTENLLNSYQKAMSALGRNKERNRFFMGLLEDRFFQLNQPDYRPDNFTSQPQ